MSDMAVLQKRKQPLNLAIVHVDPDAFIAMRRGSRSRASPGSPAL
jgi:hypothetical protein